MNVDTFAVVLATGLGPIAAVIITLWHQDRAERRGAKMRLFQTLMAHRKSNPPAAEWSQSLNLIDIVYSGNAKVVSLWHELYDILNQGPGYNIQQYAHKHLELLSEMAKALGYPELKQTDIDKYYSPQAHGEQVARALELQTELLRVLKGTERLSAEPRKPAAKEAEAKPPDGE